MKIITAIFFAFVFAGTTLNSQADTTFKLVRTIKGDIADFAVDNLDNIYILNSNNQIKKINANGDSVAVYNDVRKYGKASLIDVSNPLKTLVYYQDFATIVSLDRFLNVVNTIDLRKHDILQAKAISLSFDNRIWVYDELDNKLKKIDEDGKLLFETTDFRQLFEIAPVPQKIFDHDKYVYLYDSSLAVFVFDYYGTLKNKILINGWRDFKVFGKYIFGSDNGILHRYEISSFRLDDWKMPEEINSSSAFNFSNTRLYALRKDGISIYDYR